MKKSIGAYEAKTHFSAIVREVELGTLYSITRHGHIIADMIPHVEQEGMTRRQALDVLKELASQSQASHQEITDWRNEARGV